MKWRRMFNCYEIVILQTFIFGSVTRTNLESNYIYSDDGYGYYDLDKFELWS